VSDKKKSNGFALSIEGSQKLLDRAKDRKAKIESLLEDYICKDYALLNKDRAIEILMEYSTNLQFMTALVEQCLEEAEITVDKKSKKPIVFVEEKTASLIQSYVLINSACEGELMANHGLSFENI
jgi:glucose-6-phosphate isomerase